MGDGAGSGGIIIGENFELGIWGEILEDDEFLAGNLKFNFQEKFEMRYKKSTPDPDQNPNSNSLVNFSIKIRFTPLTALAEKFNNSK